jgi:soluble lytic murein transglycosylase-like protein
MIATRWANQDTYAAVIESAAAEYGVPASTAYGLIAQESGFNPTAVRQEPGVTCAASGVVGDASYGLTQLLYCTAQGLGYTGVPTGLFDVTTNVDLGLQLLGRLIAQHGGDIDGALSEYNGGYRPSLGYGARRADGTFANQAYVDNIDTNAAYFDQYLAQRDATSSSDDSSSDDAGVVDSSEDSGSTGTTLGAIGAALLVAGSAYAIARALKH